MKYEAIAAILERRVKSGDYILTGIPSERELATEHGVSHMTARRAVEKLISNRQLTRKSNGRLAVNAHASNGGRGKVCNVAYLTPSWSSINLSSWYSTMTRAAQNLHVVIRPVMYVHWEDSAVTEALRAFDGVFLVSLTDPIPEFVASNLARSAASVVSLDVDLSHMGIPSIRPFPAICVRTLLGHLGDLGHRRVACINTQPHSPDIVERIAEWRFWCGLRALPGDLYDSPVVSYEEPADAAYRLVRRLIESGELKASALLATTAPVALGCMRAFHECGITVGRDISLCAINDEGMARYLNPTLTSIEMAKLTPYINLCLNWMKSGGASWEGPLVVQPTNVPLFVGESTSTYEGRQD